MARICAAAYSERNCAAGDIAMGLEFNILLTGEDFVSSFQFTEEIMIREKATPYYVYNILKTRPFHGGV